MGAGHVHALYVHGESRLDRVPPQCKIAGLLCFVLAVATTPREAFWAYGLYALALVGLARLGDLGLGTVLKRLVIEVPFVAFALFLPLVGTGERIDVLGASLSVDGLWGAWNILVKGTLGVAASVILAATTSVPQILHGLDRLRLPRVFVAVTGFMVRYLDVTADEVQRMSIARRSRGHDPRWIWQAQAVASTAGTLFIRSYERGERVYVAMVARGYDGTLPGTPEEAPVTARDWAGALALPVVAAAASLAAWTVWR